MDNGCAPDTVQLSKRDSIDRPRRPAQLQYASQYNAAARREQRNEGNRAHQYISYAYPPSGFAPEEPLSAPSTRVEFREADRNAFQRPSELFLPEDAPTPRAAEFIPRTMISPLNTGLRRSVSTYSSSEYSPSLYSGSPASAHMSANTSRLPRPRDEAPTPSSRSGTLVSAISGTDTFRWQDDWPGPSPLASRPSTMSRDIPTTSAAPPSSSSRRGSAAHLGDAPFEDASQFHLFAEAMAGFSTFDPSASSHGGAGAGASSSRLSYNALSPVRHRDAPRNDLRHSEYRSPRRTASDTMTSPTNHATDYDTYQSIAQRPSATSGPLALPMAMESPREFYAPGPRAHLDKPLPLVPRPQNQFSSARDRSRIGGDPSSLHPQGHSSRAYPSSDWLALNRRFDEVLSGFGSGQHDAHDDDDDELPDYAQSQRELLAQQRAAAARRAQELELQWAKARANRHRQ